MTSDCLQYGLFLVLSFKMDFFSIMHVCPKAWTRCGRCSHSPSPLLFLLLPFQTCFLLLSLDLSNPPPSLPRSLSPSLGKKMELLAWRHTWHSGLNLINVFNLYKWGAREKKKGAAAFAHSHTLSLSHTHTHTHTHTYLQAVCDRCRIGQDVKGQRERGNVCVYVCVCVDRERERK